MGENNKENSEPLSEKELAKVEELQAEIRRKLSILLADPKTPKMFKDAFIKDGEEL